MIKDLNRLPKVSIITCTYNGERIIRDYFEKLFSQDYPLEKIEVIISDGGSTDKTQEIIDKYKKKYLKNIRLVPNSTKVKVGKGKGLDLASKKVTGGIVILIDQDNILFQKDWISKMVMILLNNPDICCVQSKLSAPEDSSSADKYLNAIGIEDPFAVDFSLNSQVVLNPKKFRYNRIGEFYTYLINKKEFYYAGDNGFAIWKKIFFETGGYTQDIDNFYRMALSSKKYKVAITKNIMLYHKSSINLQHLLSKKGFYVKRYLVENYNGRCYYWFDLKKNSLGKNLRFIKAVIFNLIFFPKLFKGIRMAIKEKKGFWMIHPIVTWLITFTYIYSFFYSKIFKETGSAKI